MASGRSPMPSSTRRRSTNNNRDTTMTPATSGNNANSSSHLFSSTYTPAYRRRAGSGTTPTATPPDLFFSNKSPPKQRGGRYSIDSLHSVTATTHHNNNKNHYPHHHHKTATLSSSSSQEPVLATKEEEEYDELEEMRELVKETCEYDPSMGVTYASLLYTKSNDIQDGLLLAKTCFQSQQYRRSISILQNLTTTTPNNNNNKWELKIVLLESSCWMSLGDYEEAIQVLESYQQSSSSSEFGHSNNEEHDDFHWLRRLLVQNPNSMEYAWYCCQRGICYEEISNPTRAALYLSTCLKFNVKCQLAWNILCQKHLLPHSKLYSLLQTEFYFPPNLAWLKPFYLTQLSTTTTATVEEETNDEDFFPNQHHLASNNASTATIDDNDGRKNGLVVVNNKTTNNYEKDIEDAFKTLEIQHHFITKDSPELSSLAAIRAYQKNDLMTALHYCQKHVASKDPLCPTALFVHISTLTALEHKRSLFALAHMLVNANNYTTTDVVANTSSSSSSSNCAAIAWYAVGCYYYVCGRYELAQRHFCRATRLSPKRAECWIAFGCSFSVCEESDQALASYRAAQKYHPSSPIPFLYMGMEYMRTNHLSLAKHFFTEAQNLSAPSNTTTTTYNNTANTNDPLICNEMGVWHYKQQNYAESIKYFQQALHLVENNINNDNTAIIMAQDNHMSFWEPTIFNLGQSYRKSKQYTNALECFERCVSLCPGKASGYSALGFTHHLLGNIDDAIEQYHLALSRKPDDTFASEMLYRALQEAMKLPLDAAIMDSDHESSFLSPSPQKSIHNNNTSRTMMNMSATMISTHNHSRLQTPEEDDDEEQFSNFTFDNSDVDISMT